MTFQSSSRGSESKPFKVQVIAELPVVRIDAGAPWTKAENIRGSSDLRRCDGSLSMLLGLAGDRFPKCG